MSTQPFVHLHCHSHYSLLDGASRIPDLVKTAKDAGMNALALTDHGNLYGALEFYCEAKSAGINPILGYEAYVAPGKRTDRGQQSEALLGRGKAGSPVGTVPFSRGGMSEASFHLTLLAKNRTGFRNLVKMASLAFTEGFYYKPRIDRELLAELHEGIICLSGCASGQFCQYILRDQLDRAAELAQWYAGVFGDDFYIEIQDNGVAVQRQSAAGALEIAEKHGFPVVATSDSHYLCQEDAQAHDVLLCINTGKFRSDPKRLQFEGNQFHLRSPEEMYGAFPDHPEAVRRSQEIADRVQIDLGLGQRHFPVFVPPSRGRGAGVRGQGGEWAASAGGADVERHEDRLSPEEYLRELCGEGLKQRYGDHPPAEAVERLERELDVICRMGFAAYFLIVWDFVRFAGEQGIPASARGSACGALVSYVLKLSHVDPLEYDLLFERFLDPNRSEAPDIDIDFCQERRDEVLRYVREKYGAENVAQIGTFGTMAARAVVRDVGRVLEMPLPRVDQITKLIPTTLHITLDEALEQSPDLKKEYENDPQVREVIDIGRRLEGLARNAGTHAAGVVIADRPLVEYVPLQLVVPKGANLARREEATLTTQWTMNDVEKAGLLKIDFLGLRNLTILDKAVQLIRETRGVEIDLYGLPLDDAETYALLERGETKGVFQLESGGIRDLLQKLKPDSFRDIIAVNALYRPGPLQGGMVDTYINVKHGREKPQYAHPILEELLAETYGVMVYQEQVMRILNRLGGIELSDAYACVKAISKKKMEQIAKFQQQFVAGAIERGLDRAKAGEIFALICHFGGYGFNKSHSTAYAQLAYQTAWLKAHYPVEFMAALLSSDMPTRNFLKKDRLVEHVEDCERMGVAVLPPDVNRSRAEFSVQDGKIVFALAAIKGVGGAVAEAIVAEREANGPFTSLFDFCERIDTSIANRAVVEALVKCGALDSLGARRSQLMAVVERAIQAGSAKADDRRRGQRSLFGGDDEEDAPAQRLAALPDVPDWAESQRLAAEKETLGFYISSHPLARHEATLQAYATHTIAQVADLRAGTEVVVGGSISSVKHSNTRRPRNGSNSTRFAMFDLEDLTGSIRAIVWPEEFARLGGLVQTDRIVFLRATVDRSREEPNLVVNDVVPLEQAGERFTRGLVIRLDTERHSERDVELLHQLCKSYPGRCEVYFDVTVREVAEERGGGAAFTANSALDAAASMPNNLLEAVGGEQPGLPVASAFAYRVVLKADAVRVAYEPALCKQLDELLGPGRVRVLAQLPNGNGSRRG